MKYSLLKDVLGLMEDFESSNSNYSNDLEGFKKWIVSNHTEVFELDDDLFWEGRDQGRTMDSVISTLLVHMNRFAKNYSKAAILGSEFSTQEDFIYLINLRAFGEMTKIDLIKKNVHDKPAGMLIINRLLSKGWVEQEDSVIDKRSKVIKISSFGISVLDNQMDKIRQASSLVTGNLSDKEKLELIKLLNKLNDFHQLVYNKHVDADRLLVEASLLKNEKL